MQAPTSTIALTYSHTHAHVRSAARMRSRTHTRKRVRIVYFDVASMPRARNRRGRPDTPEETNTQPHAGHYKNSGAVSINCTTVCAMEELVSTKRTYLGPESWALRVRAAHITGTAAVEGPRVRLTQAHPMAAAVAAGRRRSGPSGKPGKSGKLGKFKSASVKRAEMRAAKHTAQITPSTPPSPPPPSAPQKPAPQPRTADKCVGENVDGDIFIWRGIFDMD